MSNENLINAGPCCRCKTNFSLPEPLFLAAKASESITFYCPYGHPQIFRKGETDAEKMRRERDQLRQRLAQKDDEIIHQRDLTHKANRRTAAAKGQVTKLKNRASAGVCPCCNRTFQNLASHMKGKHPNFNKEKPMLKVVGSDK